MRYVELHSRSAFSFLEGGSLPEALIATCAERDVPAMALLDRNGVYGAPRFHFAAKNAGVKAHTGAEVSVAEGGNCPVLVQSRIGYQNLCRMLTTAKMRCDKSVVATVTLGEMRWHAEGLICLTGDEKGPLALALQRGGIDAGRRLLRDLIGVFGQENIYVELQRHFNRHQEARNQAAVTLARELRLPLLATNGVCYATAAERQIADVFCCIKNKCRLDTAGRLLAKTPNAMCAARNPWRACLPTFPKRWPIPSSFPPGSNFRWKIWAMSFPGIRYRKARP